MDGAGGTHATPVHLFVYGTLQPGEVRWQHLAAYVVGDGIATSVKGELYDTGLRYPAAMFVGSDTIAGRIYELSTTTRSDALAHLDHVEGAVRGLYHRVVVVTATGTSAWAYQCGDPELLVRRIAGGDWLQR